MQMWEMQICTNEFVYLKHTSSWLLINWGKEITSSLSFNQQLLFVEPHYV